ncbi:MAG: AAA family ATPase [Acidobacteria bacterium]|nr:AAA family ATPase [Acidobacteriota bacterium]
MVGTESAGKTSLARDLAARYATTWVPEFGRMHSEVKLRTRGGSTWQTAWFVLD